MLLIDTDIYMSRNLEKNFYLELKKRKQQRKDKLASQIPFRLRAFFSRLKRIQPRYLFGLTLLFIAIAHQYNLNFITNPFHSLVTNWRYQPAPPISQSPWSWQDHNQLHPLIANINPQTEKSIKSVADYIASNESDPYLRVKAAHDYVISRVDYDLDVLTTSRRPAQDALTVFKTHKAVCEGYARLFKALNQAMGSEAVYVRGRVRRDLAPIDLIPANLRLGTSRYDWTLHAWNAVKVNDSWQLVDPTWDDNKQNKYSADYLMISPEAMISSHLPDLASWQLLVKTISPKNFEKAPILQPQFFSQNLKLIFPQEYETDIENSALIKLQKPDNYQSEITAFATPIAKESFLAIDLFKKDQKKSARENNFRRCSSVNQGSGKVEISCDFPQPGKYRVLLFSEGEDSTMLGELKFS